MSWAILVASWAVFGRLGLNRARSGAAKDRSGATPVLVSELFQVAKKIMRVKSGQVPIGPLGEGGETKSRSRGLKTLHETPRGSKRQRRLLRSPKSTYPKGLAPNRRKKKGGRAAVIPLGEVNKILEFVYPPYGREVLMRIPRRNY